MPKSPTTPTMIEDPDDVGGRDARLLICSHCGWHVLPIDRHRHHERCPGPDVGAVVKRLLARFVARGIPATQHGYGDGKIAVQHLAAEHPRLVFDTDDGLTYRIWGVAGHQELDHDRVVALVLAIRKALGRSA